MTDQAELPNPEDTAADPAALLRVRDDGWTWAKQPDFLEHLAETGVVVEAACAGRRTTSSNAITPESHRFPIYIGSPPTQALSGGGNDPALR
jgi:hypothetical protein